MAFRRCDLQEVFFVPGTYAFRVLGYGTADPLDVVLAPGYFATAGSLLHPGELIYVRMVAAAGGQPSIAAAGPAHVAVLMVLNGRRGCADVRLVQDFGRSDAPAADRAGAPADPAPPPAVTAAPAPPPKRGRGRPPGSRNKKNGALAAPTLN
jgi:hypothetical protein